MFGKLPGTNNENVVIQGITHKKILIVKSTLINFKLGDLDKTFICYFDIELTDSDYFEQYHGIVDLNNKLLGLNNKFLALQIVTEKVIDKVRFSN